ncbi:MAG: hypothetical protein ACYCQJ_05600 [Nitrososphaerales archaeon]
MVNPQSQKQGELNEVVILRYVQSHPRARFEEILRGLEPPVSRSVLNSRLAHLVKVDALEKTGECYLLGKTASWRLRKYRQILTFIEIHESVKKNATAELKAILIDKSISAETRIITALSNLDLDYLNAISLSLECGEDYAAYFIQAHNRFDSDLIRILLRSFKKDKRALPVIKSFINEPDKFMKFSGWLYAASD